MRIHSVTLLVLVLAACSSSHVFPTRPLADAGDPTDARPPEPDGGTAPDAPVRAPCEDGLVEERGRCVGWRLAASLPFEVGLWGVAGERPPRVVRIASSGEPVVESGDGALFRYVPAADRFEEVPATDVVPIDAPSDALPERGVSEYGRALGWLDDGTRVLATVSYYSVQWVADRDDHGDGAWQTTVQPPDFFEAAVAYPIDARSILFAGRFSAIYVVAP